MINLYLDDVRGCPGDTGDAPEGYWYDFKHNIRWYVVRTYRRCIEFLEQHKGEIEIFSLDHDLADYDAEGNEVTGYHVLTWMAEQQHLDQSYPLPKTMQVHSYNIVARPRMNAAIDQLYKPRR